MGDLYCICFFNHLFSVSVVVPGPGLWKTFFSVLLAWRCICLTSVVQMSDLPHLFILCFQIYFCFSSGGSNDILLIFVLPLYFSLKVVFFLRGGWREFPFPRAKLLHVEHWSFISPFFFPSVFFFNGNSIHQFLASCPKRCSKCACVENSMKMSWVRASNTVSLCKTRVDLSCKRMFEILKEEHLIMTYNTCHIW